jgi:hypothetical protein
MPIVGSFAGASARAYGLGAGVAIGDFESIQTITVGTAVSSIEFTSIPATYTHLQIRMFTRNATAESNDYLQFNADTGSNYAWHELWADGANAFSSNGTSTTFIKANYAFTDASIFGTSVIDILDYKDTNKYKTVRALAGVDKNGAGYVFLRSGHWRSNSAITSIKLFPAANNFAQYSSFALYGVKA